MRSPATWLKQKALLEARTGHFEVANKMADERIATLTAIVRMLDAGGVALRHSLGASARRDIKR
jgi:hypothetical protein